MKKFLLILGVVALAIAGFALGRITGEGSVAISSVHETAVPELLPVPKFVDLVQSSGGEQKDLILELPAEGATVTESFEVSGRVKLAVGAVSLSVQDATGQEIYRAPLAITPLTSDYGRFTASVRLAGPLVGDGVLTVSRLGTASADEVLAVRRLTFGMADGVKIEVFFGRSGFGDDVTCAPESAVERWVSKKGSIYRAALEALIAGPTPAEKSDGYYTSLPETVTVKSVAADASGVVTADFDSKLEQGVGGSCRVSAIRAQIAVTLKQFPEVRDVVVSVNGRTEDVLQP